MEAVPADNDNGNGTGDSRELVEGRPTSSRQLFSEQVEEAGIGEEIAILARSRWATLRITQFIRWQWGIQVSPFQVRQWIDEHVDPTTLGPKREGLRASLEESSRIVDALAEQTALIELQWQRLEEGRKNEQEGKILTQTVGEEINRLADLLKTLVDLQRSYNLFPTLKSVQTFFGHLGDNRGHEGGSVIAAQMVKEQLVATGMGEIEAHTILMRALVGPERLGSRVIDADVIDAQGETEPEDAAADAPEPESEEQPPSPDVEGS